VKHIAESRKPTVAPAPLYHAPCAFNRLGVSKDVCESTTRIPCRNLKCSATNCTSGSRACSICVLESHDPQLVIDSHTGLCGHHTNFGIKSKAPPRDRAWERLHPILEEVETKSEKPILAPEEKGPQKRKRRCKLEVPEPTDLNAKVSFLSPRRLEILKLVMAGMSDKEMGMQLLMQTNNVCIQVSVILKFFEVPKSTEFGQRAGSARRQHLVDLLTPLNHELLSP
jgi:hypothetical protein